MPETVTLCTVRRPVTRRSAGRRTLATLGAVALFAAGLTGAGATALAAPVAPVAAATCSDTGATAYATGLSPLPCLAGPSGRTRWSDDGQLLVPQGPVNLFVGDRRLVRAFTLVCSNGGSLACPAGVTGPVPPAVTPSVVAVQRLFVQSRSGYPTQYGELARLPVNQPTSAGLVQGTIELAQATTDGNVVRPVVARQSLASLPYPEGTTVAGFEQYGPNPGPGQAFVQGAVAGSGPAVVTLTNVTVRGQALDLGDCAATGTLRVSARGGWTNAAPVPGGPAEYRAFTAPSFLHAKLSGVRAVGCDDVDPAVTAVLLTNARFLQQTTIDFTAASALTAYGCLVAARSGCTSRHPATVDPARVPATL